MLNTQYKEREASYKVNDPYNFKQTKDERWGIYAGDRLLATVGSYEACQSIGKSLQHLLWDLGERAVWRFN